MPLMLAAVDYVTFLIAAAIVLAVIALAVVIAVAAVKRADKVKKTKREIQSEFLKKAQTDDTEFAKSLKQEKPVFTKTAEEKPTLITQSQTEKVCLDKVISKTEIMQQPLGCAQSSLKPRFISVKYSRSFTAKLMQADNAVKQYYSDLKNCLLSYKGVKSRVCWRWETFRYGRKPLVKICLRGKTLSLAFALNTQNYADGKYAVEDISHIAAYAETPCLYRIKNARRALYAQQLIADVMESCNVQVNQKFLSADYVRSLPYKSIEALLALKLVKELTAEEAPDGEKFNFTLRKRVSASEADGLLRDDVAAALVRRLGGAADKSCTAIVNIDTLSQTFDEGDVVTLDDIKRRVKGFNAKVTYLKVLARGVLDKRLIIYADSFSPQAVKMIVLTGGEAIKK